MMVAGSDSLMGYSTFGFILAGIGVRRGVGSCAKRLNF